MDHEASQGDANSSYHHYMERAYKYRPVKVIDFDSPRQHCIVYLDLKQEEWGNLFPSGMQEKGSAAFTVGYEFASRTKPLEEFVSKYKRNYTFTGGKAVGYRYLFGMPWMVFIEEDGPIFINGVLHLRAELTVK